MYSIIFTNKHSFVDKFRGKDRETSGGVREYFDDLINDKDVAKPIGWMSSIEETDQDGEWSEIDDATPMYELMKEIDDFSIKQIK